MCYVRMCNGSHKCRKCKINEAKKMLPKIARKKVPMYALQMRKPGINVLGKFSTR
jgi:hypothetical protein